MYTADFLRQSRDLVQRHSMFPPHFPLFARMSMAPRWKWWRSEALAGWGRVLVVRPSSSSLHLLELALGRTSLD